MIPERFKERMSELLGDEYPSFEEALSLPGVRAVRVNGVKISTEHFLAKTTLDLSPISYAEDGFIPSDCEGIGRSAEHHSGMFYVQDPGAMATVKSIEIKSGWRVLDACAAPGGKASQLAAAVGEDGFVLANEFVPKRAKIIVSNFERLGIKNAMILSTDTERLSEMFSCYFDLVLCDAPCSGEGMFRKYDEAITEWSEENVLACARRQKEILENCSKTVKSGGYLLYSTCTYSKEENEGVISEFLGAHPEFSLCEVNDNVKAATADGIDGLSEARRFYPHLQQGEGQFIALMKKDENCGDLPTILYKDSAKSPSKDEIAVINKFFDDNLIERPKGRLIKWGESVAIVSHDLPVPSQSVFMAGVMLGEVKKGVLTPHHQFFSVYGKAMKRQESLTVNDNRVQKYLRGEEIDTEIADNGYCAILYEGVCLGGGKIVNGKIKNHYPKGLRNNK